MDGGNGLAVHRAAVDAALQRVGRVGLQRRGGASRAPAALLNRVADVALRSNQYFLLVHVGSYHF